MSDQMPTDIPFQHSSTGTLGVEMEWMTVDQGSGAQIPAAPFVFEVTGSSARIKPELFTSTVEINTDIHHTTAAAIDQLQALYNQVSDMLAGRQAALLSTGTHPFSHWRDQQISDDPRYGRLLDRLQWMARRFNIFGIHVHVGMPDGDSCIHAMNHLLPVLPVFLAISANSPFWHGEDTGLSASRIKIFEGLSQGGMPFYFENWRDFEHCAGRLQATGSIDSVRDIWWEMRPHPDFGTLEVRIGDMPACRDDAAAYIAYVRAEAMAALHADAIPRIHPSLIRENRWRACRFGMRATIIDPFTEELIPVLDWLEKRLERLDQCGIDRSELALVAGRMDCWRSHGGGDAIQRHLFSRQSSLPDLVRAIRLQDGWNS
ncbi:YbdK family carboxylate-amine ligase [Mariprofundus erugo]|uniref:Putative glutamate--cysteine ligase 2 n=1 Tax=Mariprofundus erugo TaxID=2528639 RepID=A0A5R9GUL1_9PROT|nr:YbdK family carboxylate-amine ligase [Mariprofundus erugo]TLS67917.1 YbdK family carboxylate-amine ligase [Mariprofundus erugo]